MDDNTAQLHLDATTNIDWVLIGTGDLQKLGNGEQVEASNTAGLPVLLDGQAFSGKEIKQLQKSGVIVDQFAGGGVFAVTVLEQTAKARRPTLL